MQRDASILLFCRLKLCLSCVSPPPDGSSGGKILFRSLTGSSRGIILGSAGHIQSTAYATTTAYIFTGGCFKNFRTQLTAASCKSTLGTSVPPAFESSFLSVFFWRPPSPLESVSFSIVSSICGTPKIIFFQNHRVYLGPVSWVL